MTWNKSFQNMLKKLLKVLIRGYQLSLAGLLGGQCRFYPSCSQYAVAVLHGHSLTSSLVLIIKRIARCHPFHPGGVDLVPEVKS